jgi:hypothetical protein
MQNELHRSVAEEPQYTPPPKPAAPPADAAAPLRQEPAGNLRQDPKAKA